MLVISFIQLLSVCDTEASGDGSGTGQYFNWSRYVYSTFKSADLFRILSLENLHEEGLRSSRAVICDSASGMSRMAVVGVVTVLLVKKV